MESVEIRGTLEAINLKDASTCEIKLKADYDDDLRSLIKRRVVLQVEPEVSQPALPMDNPPAKDVPGQQPLFATDGKPRIMLLCQKCGIETKHRPYSGGRAVATDGKSGTLWVCDICDSVRLVEEPEPPVAVDKPADSVGTEGESAGETPQTVDIKGPVTCPVCGSEMAVDLVEGERPWLCVNEDCVVGYLRHRISNEEAREIAETGEDEERGTEAKADAEVCDQILICPSCRQDEMLRSDDGDTWECIGCGHWLTNDEANELLAEDDHAEPDQDDEGEELAEEAQPAVRLRRWADPATGKVYEVNQGLGLGWGLFERKPSGGCRRVRGVEYQDDRQTVEAAAADYANLRGWQEVTDDEEPAPEPAEMLDIRRGWCQMCQIERRHELIMVAGERKLRCTDCGTVTTYREPTKAADSREEVA